MTTPILPADALIRIDTYWSQLLNCSVTDLRPEQPTVYVSPRSPGLTALRLNDHWVIAVNPAYDRQIADEVLARLTGADLSDRGLRDALHHFMREQGFSEFYGPSELLYLTRDMLIPVPTVSFRPLGPEDADIVDQFRVSMGGVLDWRIDDPEGWPYVIGHFDGPRLVAAAAVHNWGNVIAETYVDTLPEYRGRGLANALTYEITRWIVEETSRIAQAGGEVVNTPSGRISRRLGYAFYGYLFMNNLARAPHLA